MKITIDTENKTLTLLEEIDLLDLVLFVEGIANISDWKIIPYVKEKMSYIGVPYKEPVITPSPFTQPWTQPWYDTPYKVTCSTTSLNGLLNQSSCCK